MVKIGRLVHRVTALRGVCTLALLTLAGTASGHVAADPGTAQRGSVTKVSFRVPNEGAASTTQLEINCPADHPIAFVSTRAMPGWTSTVRGTRHRRNRVGHGRDRPAPAQPA